MKYILYLLIFFSFPGLAQQLDFEKIKLRSAKDFNQLSSRFSKADTSLTLEDIQVLYYGFAFQPAYDPEVFIPIENRIRDLNSSGKPSEAISLADSLLAVYPVSIVALFEKSYASAFLQRAEEEFLSNRKYKALLRTILNSGDGLTAESAYVVISPNDEFDVIRYFGLTATSFLEFEYNGRIYDILQLKKNKRKMDKIFFDITLPAKLKEKKKVDALKEGK